MHYNKTFRRFLAMVLTIVIVLGMLPASATAQSLFVSTSSEIISFETLPEAIATQMVPIGTPLDDLDLPQTVQATIRIASGTDVPKVEEPVQDSGEPEQNSGEPKQNEDISMPVSWISFPDYNGDVAGVYAFTSVLPTEYTLADDASPPKIFVTVGESPAIPAMALMGTPPEASVTTEVTISAMALMGTPLGVNVTTETELKTIFQSGGTVMLGADIIITTPLIVPLGKTVILNLNGYTIDRGLTGGTAVLNGNVVTVNGSLTLEDSQEGGKITGGRKSGVSGGGCIYVNGGSLTMNGGSIMGNTTTGSSYDTFVAGGDGGGVYIKDGTFIMSGGAISYNESAGNGGGVYIEDSNFIMSGGTISENKAANDGGGVYVYGGNFTMEDGTISENKAIGAVIPVDGGGVVAIKGDGGGVNVHAGGVFTMNKGNISGNKARQYGGGVYAFLGGVIIMNGGSISNNDAAKAGGGIYFDKTLDKSFEAVYGVGTLTINGGEVCNNTTETSDDFVFGFGGGVYVGNGCFSIMNCKINGNQAINGGGVFILAGTGVMENSEISQNSATWLGGGVYITNGVLDGKTFIGSLTTKSSKVNKNTALKGGGVYVAGGSFLTLESGQINENNTYAKEGSMSDGGGVYVNTGCTFTMRGGEICGNATSTWFMYGNGGGVFVYGGSFKVSGDIKIQNNSRDSALNNVYLHTGEQIIQIEGSLMGADGSIGISTGNSKVSPLTVAQGEGYTLSEADLKKFASDKGSSLSLEDNKITLPDPSASYLIFLSYNANGGSGSKTSSAILDGMDKIMTVASGDGFSFINCTFAGWNTKADGSGTSYQPESKLSLTANTVLYAQWSIIKTELAVTAPQCGATPINFATCSPIGITTVLVWKQNGIPLTGNFNYNTAYSVEITLTATSGCKFSSAPEAVVNGAPAVVQRNSDTELVVSYTFAKTDLRSAPKAAITPSIIDVSNTGGSQPLALNIAGIVEGYNAVTWTMSKTEDSGNILTLPDITNGTLTNGALSLGNFIVASNSTGQPSKSAKVSIVFGGNEGGDYAGVPISLTVTFQLAAGASPEAKIDFINEKITAVSSEMEYIITDSAGAPADWTGLAAVTETEIPIGGIIPAAGSTSKYIHIRYKNIAGSVPMNLEIPARPDLVAFFGDTWDSWVTNNVLTNIEMGGVYEDFGYRINSGIDMVNKSGGGLDIPLNSGDTLTFWMPAVESSFKSAEIIVTAPPRLAKPVVAVDLSVGKLNTTAGMEYRLNEAVDWTTCTPNMAVTDFGWNGTESVNVWFRYPCTNDNYASEAQMLIILDAACTTAKSAVQDASYADLTQGEAADENAIKAALKSTAETAVNNSSIIVNINKVSYTEPVAGTASKPSGTNGSYTFTVTVSKGGQSSTSEQKTIIIKATAYTGITDAQAVAAAKTAMVDGNVSVAFGSDQTAKVAAVQAYVNSLITGEGKGVTATVTYNSGTGKYEVELSKGSTNDTKSLSMTVDVAPDPDIAVVAGAKSTAQGASYMDLIQAAIKDEEVIKVALKATAETAINNSSITVNINKVSYTKPVAGTVAKTSGTNGNYTFTITVSKGGQSDTTEQKTIIIKATAYTGGNNSNWSNDDSDSRGSYTPVPPVPPVPPVKPTKPVTGKTVNKATVDNSGTTSIRISDQNIVDAIANAKVEAIKNSVNAGEITVAINVSTDVKNAHSLTANLPKATQQQIINNKIAGIELAIDRPDITMRINLAAVTEINRQANADVQLALTKIDGSKLSSAGKNTIGSRPVYNFKASYQNGSKNVTDFGKGTVYARIPYTPAKNEAIGCLYIVYVDSNGKLSRVSGSAYDTNSKSLIFTTNHFSVYGVGYTAPSTKFTDIDKHWAKDSIDYVVGRGLFSGITKTTFSPDTAIQRGMLVMALGRLAGVDTKKYTKNSFTDVKADSPFHPYIEWAYSKGIIQGIGIVNSQIAPDRPVTREEIAVIMANYAKAMSYKLPEARNTITFADASSIGSGSMDAVRSMQQAGIMMSESNNKFNPKANATRAEVSAMIHRYIKLTIDPATSQGWALNDDGQYMYYKDSKNVTEWQNIIANGSSKTYYFTGDGIMVSGKWLEINKKWYYFYSDGSLAVSTEVDGYKVDKNGARKEK